MSKKKIKKKKKSVSLSLISLHPIHRPDENISLRGEVGRR